MSKTISVETILSVSITANLGTEHDHLVNVCDVTLARGFL